MTKKKIRRGREEGNTCKKEQYPLSPKFSPYLPTTPSPPSPALQFETFLTLSFFFLGCSISVFLFSHPGVSLLGSNGYCCHCRRRYYSNSFHYWWCWPTIASTSFTPLSLSPVHPRHHQGTISPRYNIDEKKQEAGKKGRPVPPCSCSAVQPSTKPPTGKDETR